MLIVLSPAKSLDYETPAATQKHTQPEFMRQAASLVDILHRLSPSQIASLMKISDSLAALNAGRFASWMPECTTENAKQAVLAFSGDVYQGLEAGTLTSGQFDWLQSHVRILSGLYGVLRPLDLMQPYRLEMGTKLSNPRGKDLYAFWGATITECLNRAMKAQKTKVLVNLASEEYFKSLQLAQIDAPVITPVFQDWSGGKYKVLGFYAKRARGLMTRYAAVNGLKQVEQLKDFDVDGYAYDEHASSDTDWVFRRRK